MDPGNRTLPHAFWRDLFLWAVLALALALRIGYSLALHPGGHPASSFIIDEREYFGAAHMLAEGRGFSYFDTALWVRPPLYVMLLAAIMRLWGDGYVPILLVQALVSTITLVPIGWLAFRLGGPTPARCALILATLYLPLTLFAGLLLSETLFVLLFMLSLAALFRTYQCLHEGSSRSLLVWTLVAGLLLGLATLTRATALAFVPLAALWLAGAARTYRPAARIALAGLLVGACLLTLLPWTIRNYAAYGRLVLVDTTSGYNLWLASVGVKDEERLQSDLRAIPNPADRQNFAYAQAWKNIASDPLAFLAKGYKESLDLWRPLFSAEERQVSGYSLGRVPSWHLIAVVLLDDLLYIAILVFAIAGFMLSPPHPVKWLVALWVLLWVAMAFVFFAVTRFRLPVVAALLPWSGMGLSALLHPRAASAHLSRIRWPSRLPALMGLVLVAVVIAPAVPLGAEQTPLGVERWSEQSPFRAAEALLAEGRVQDAIQEYEQGNTSLPDTRYGLAAALLQAGDTQQALHQLVSSEPQDRFEPFLIRGEAARLSGDTASARNFFNARAVKLAGDDALEWAWTHFRPSPLTELDIGNGLDIGYIRGFYSPETSAQGEVFRWASPQAEVRGLVASRSLPSITWSGWRPAGLAQARVSLSQIPSGADGAASNDGTATYTLPASDTWSTQPLAASPAGQNAELLMQTNGFIGGGNDPRLLGIRVAKMTSAP